MHGTDRGGRSAPPGEDGNSDDRWSGASQWTAGAARLLLRRVAVICTSRTGGALECAVAVAVLAAGGAAHAQPADSLADGTGQPVRDYSEMPRPDRATGYAIAPTRRSSPALWIPRAILFVPRVALEIVGAPVRGGLWAFDRYQLGERAIAIMFNDERTFGIYPVVFIDSGFGLNAGLRLVHRDLFGSSERLGLRAGYGGRSEQHYEAKLDSGDRLAPLTLEIHGEYAIEPRERFFGIGNADQVDPDPGMAPLDPFVDDEAVASRYRDTSARGFVTGDVAIWDALHADARAGAERHELDSSDDPRGDLDITDAYDTSMLPGFDTATDAWVGELHLAFDTRRNANRFVSRAVPGTGWLVDGYVGFNAPIGDGHRSFWRSGGGVQYFIDLYRGTRVIGLRAVVDQVHAPADEVPFVYLPSLGGGDMLRGYQTDRFRDRAMTMASAEYTWPMSREVFPYVFADAGRVHESLADPSFDDVRVGFGAGLQVHSRHSFWLRTTVSSSIDGGVYFNLSFDPVVDARAGEDK